MAVVKQGRTCLLLAITCFLKRVGVPPLEFLGPFFPSVSLVYVMGGGGLFGAGISWGF